MELIRRESLADQAADALWKRIRAGEWEVGGKLPGETTLAPQLGVGRSTVREAIRQLVGLGVLSSRQGAGVFITSLEKRGSLDARLSSADIDAVIEARIAIEAEASTLAAHRRTPGELAHLRKALVDRSHHRDDVEMLVDKDMAFHRGIVTAAHNPVLLELFDHFAPRNRQAMIDMLLERGTYGDDADHRVHEKIYSAIESGDGDAAAGLTRAHLRSLRHAVS